MAYLQDHFLVTPAQYQFVRDLTRGCDEDTFKLFCHVLVCSVFRLTSKDDDLFIPVAWETYHEEWPKADWRPLKERGLLEPTGYDRHRGRSRAFKVAANWILAGFLAAGETDECTPQMMNLFTGRPSNRTRKNQINDDNNHREPELVRCAMQTITKNGCPFDFEMVKDHIHRSAADVEAMPETTAKLKARRRLENNKYCLQAVQRQKPQPDGEGMFIYTPAYKVSSTGRIHQIGGALQSCTREMKDVAYAGVQNVRNYDLSASQVNALIQLFDEAGLDTGWLIAYRNTERNKEVYAARAGLQVETWKQCLLTLVMGGHLPRKAKNFESRSNSVLKDLAEEAGGDLDRLNILLAGFTEVVMPLVEQLKKWHEWLLTVYLPVKKRNSPAGWFILNATGKRKYLEDLTDWDKPHGRDRWLAKSELAAFLLQGIEAAMIHNLTLLGSEYGFKPIANEHDGLVVTGEIPPEAVSEASRLSGFRHAKLDEKWFVQAA